MARICEPCRVHTADDSLKTCSKCQQPTKFTLLAPLGEEMEPLEGVPRKRYGVNPEPEGCPLQPQGLGSLLFGRKYGPMIVVGTIGFFALLFVTSWFASADDFDESVDMLYVGMSMEDAVEIMGGQPKPRRGDDFDMTIDTTGDGDVTWEGGSNSVTVTYKDGRVTKIDKGKATGGMRKKTTVYTR